MPSAPTKTAVPAHVHTKRVAVEMLLSTLNLMNSQSPWWRSHHSAKAERVSPSSRASRASSRAFRTALTTNAPKSGSRNHASHASASTPASPGARPIASHTATAAATPARPQPRTSRTSASTMPIETSPPALLAIALSGML